MKKILQWSKNNYNLSISILLALLLAILATFFVPEKGYDLYEYYNWMNNMKSLNFIDLINYLFLRGEFISMLYLYIMSIININPLVQFFPVFLFYFIMFYIIIDYSKQNKLKKGYIIFIMLLFFGLCKYIFIVSCFRYFVALAIFTLALYRDYVKKEKNKLIIFLYLIPIFIHSSMIIFLFFRLLVLIKNKNIKYSIVFAIIFVFVFSKLSYNIVSEIADFLNIDYFKAMAKKFFDYTQNQDNLFNNLNIKQNIFRILQCSFFEIIFLIIYTNKCLLKLYNKKYLEYLLLITLFTLSIITYFNMYLRFVEFILYSGIIILIKLFSKIDDSMLKKYKYIITICLLIFIIGGFVIQVPTYKQLFFKGEI